MQIFHITSLRNAYSIIRSGRYEPCYCNPLAQDSGLNAGIVGEHLANQKFESTGVKLILEWSGTVAKNQKFPLPYNILLNELPWRVIISYGTTQGLKAIAIQVEDEDQYHEIIPPLPFWTITKNLKSWWIKKEIKSVKRHISSILNANPSIVVSC